MCSDIRGLYKAVRDRVWVALRVCGYSPGRAVLARATTARSSLRAGTSSEQRPQAPSSEQRA